MRRASYLEQKLISYCWIFIIGLLFNLIIFVSLHAVEPTKSIQQQQQPSNIQDEKNKKPVEKSISDADEKLWLKQLEIYGQIAKPQTVFIIPGTDPRVDGLKIDRHFFSHIFRPVEKSTLQRVQAKQGKDQDHILW